MNFIKTPMKGMPEQLPQDMEIREYAIEKIKKTYTKFGFSLISTPAIEHIENLTSKQGGENEQLIFKIFKRGDKLENAVTVEDMCDSGLRYDLTLPLSRFYANNVDSLTMPFKAFQIGSVWRADRPQKGRFREFTQCDIDILGDESILAEIELITATCNMLKELGLENIKVRVNDRNILKSMALSQGFDQEKLESIYIILDKLDKIGFDEVKNSLIQLGLNEENVIKYMNYFATNNGDIVSIDALEKTLDGYIDKNIIQNLKDIINCTSSILDKSISVVFDPTLVRGMGYYTGTIFEIELNGYNLSIAGGGRYDKMIGNFMGSNVPACGFSIGFERIISIIKDNNLKKNISANKTAFLINKDLDNDKIVSAIIKANEMRNKGEIVMITPRNKNVKFQKEKLATIGYTNFVEVFNDKQIN